MSCCSLFCMLAILISHLLQLANGDSSWKKLQSLLVQLRKVCQHPYLLPTAEPDFDGFSTGALSASLWVCCL